MARTSVGFGVVLGVVFGAICGALGMHFTGSETAAGEADALHERAVKKPPEEPPALVDPGERAPLSEANTESARESVEAEGADALLSPALLEYARENLAKGWAAERQDKLPEEQLAEGMQRFEELVMTSPTAIGRELGTRENKREEALRDAESGGLFALLASLESGEAGPLPNLVRDRAEFDKYFLRDSNEEHSISGVGLTRKSFEDMVDGTTLTFPAGVYELSELVRYWRDVPRDITIRGGGRDATLIVVRGIDSRSAPLKNLTIENCTLFAENNIFMVRSGAGSATFRNVRVTGFDTGAGGSSVAFAGSGIAMRWIDCIFAGGYGRAPQFGNLLDLRTEAVLMRFERCRFERLNLDLIRLREGATAIFALCEFWQLLDRRDPQVVAEGHPGIVLEQCTFEAFDPRKRVEKDDLRRDLNDLFPNWKAEIER